MANTDPHASGAPSEKAWVILCTVPSEGDHAVRLARGLVESALAACVNIVGPIRSIHRWEGAVQSEDEFQLVIKTGPDRYEAVEAYLLREHPYDVPEIVAIPIRRGSTSYLDWLDAQTR